MLYMYSNLSSFPFNHKTSFRPQFVTKNFLNVCCFTYIFQDHNKIYLTFNAKGRRVGSHACRFHCEGDVHSPTSILIMFYYSMVPLISSPFS
jgi:hypothetical protein